jgi:catecholate siderophore receptor
MAAVRNAQFNAALFTHGNPAAVGRAQLRLALLGSVASLAVSAELAPVLAQGMYGGTPAPPPSSPSDTGPMALPTIAVEGAQKSTQAGYKADESSLGKLTEPLLNTPFTVETVTRQLMDDQGVTTLRDALRNVPGISLASGEGSSQGDSLTIRGFTARNDIFLDGMRDFGSYYRDPFYLQNIQVLKGPASILFGRGSTGGIVEQDSKLPTLTPFANGTLMFGTDQTKRLTADVDQPLPDLGEGSALRLNVMANQNGIADRDVVQYNRFGIAPALVMGLGTPTRFTFTYLHLTEYDHPDYGLPWLYSATPGSTSAISRPPPLSLTQSNYYGFEHGNFLRTNVDVPTIKIEHDFNDAITLTDQLRYGHYSRQFNITEPQKYTLASALTPGATGTLMLQPPGTPFGNIIISRNQLVGSSVETYLDNQLDATVRFNTGFVGHTLRAGIEVGRETSDPIRYSTIGPYSLTSLLFPNPQDTNNSVIFESTNTDTTATSQAVYGLDTITFSPQWQLMAGLRYDRFKPSFTQVAFPNPVTGVITTPGASFNQINGFVSWRSALIYKPLPNGSIYVDGGNSFNPSAEALSLSLATAPLPPVINTTAEMGTKWELLDGGLSLNGSLFRTVQQNVREPDPNNPLFNILAGTAVAKGVELIGTGYITPVWEIVAGYAYTFSEITKSPVTGPLSDLGNQLANVPRHTANLWTTYKLPFKLEVGGGLNVVSSRFAASTPVSVGGVPFLKEAPGYWTAGLMARYPVAEHVSLQLNLNNITNNQFYDLLHPSHIVPGAGRTAWLTLNFTY